jgi:3-methyladenine DNA glycosylase AlkD
MYKILCSAGPRIFRQNDVDDTFKIAGLLVNDKHDLINKAVGSWIRKLRYAVEKPDKGKKICI